MNKFTKGDILVDDFGTRIKLLTYVSKKGTAKVKVLEPGEMLMAQKGEVVGFFNVIYGLLQFKKEA